MPSNSEVQSNECLFPSKAEKEDKDNEQPAGGTTLTKIWQSSFSCSTARMLDNSVRVLIPNFKLSPSSSNLPYCAGALHLVPKGPIFGGSSRTT